MSYSIGQIEGIGKAWAELEPLFRELHEHHEPLIGHKLLPNWVARQSSYYESQTPMLILVARIGGEAIGFMNGRVIRDPEVFEEAYGFIDNAYVRPPSRRKGVGRALLRRAEAWYESNGVAEIRLSVYAANNLGVRFWELAGFEPQSITMRKAL